MGYGFIRKPEDIKSLIIYSLSLLPFALSDGYLYDLVSVDDGFDYFEFSQAADELVQRRLIALANTEKGKAYVLTPLGAETNDTMKQYLPPSVREKAEKKAIEVTKRVRRERSIKTSHIYNPGDKSFTAHLAVVDNYAEQFSINVKLYSESQCTIVENNFKRNAELLYGYALDVLSGNVKQGEKL